MKIISACPVCGSNTLTHKHSCVDFLVTKSSFDILECADCGACATSPQPEAGEIATFYESEEYIAHSGKSTGLIEILYKIVRRYTLRRKRTFMEDRAGLIKGTILDFGCGTGEFLHVCQQQGWTVTGLEPGESARRKATRLLGTPVLDTADLTTLDRDQFDVITLWHVLEHVPDPVAVISQLKRILKHNGALIVAVPNYTGTDARYYGSAWAAWDVPRHLVHFSPRAMRHLAAQAGLTITRVTGMPFDPFYVSLLTEKSVKSNGRLWRGFAIGFWSWLTALLRWENSSSLIYVMKDETV
ncbi:MAG: class I SAM-dependent methyltransferase [Fidelibacterota bacterium]